MGTEREVHMIVHKVQAIVTEDGKLLLQGLPFQAGARVEVIVLDESAGQKSETMMLVSKTIFIEEPYSLT
jgi:hypothetical protein